MPYRRPILCSLIVLAALAAPYTTAAQEPVAAHERNLTALQCIELFSSDISRLYTEETNNSVSSIERLVRGELVPCLDAAQQTRSLDVRMLATVIKNFPRNFFTNLADKFNNSSSLPYNIAFQFLPADAWTGVVDEVLLQVKKNLSTTASTGFLYGGLQLPVFASNNAMADLSALVLAEGRDLGWLDILPFVRQQMATYDGKLVGIPLDGRANMMFYRLDVLQHFNLSVPDTYDDLLEVVARVNGTRLGPNGTEMWGMCMPYLGESKSCLLSHNLFWDVLAPMTQTNGSSHGMAVDPNNLDILFDSEAGAHALTLLRTLLRFTHPERPCADWSDAFVHGQCAFTFGRAAQYKKNVMDPTSRVRGITRAMVAPGSNRVLNRATRRLEPCTAAMCPLARPTRRLNGSVLLVNQAPFSSASGYAAGVSSVAPPTQQLATFRYLSFLAQSEEMRDVILDPTTWWGPCRVSHFNVSAWVARGYEEVSTRHFLDTTQQLMGEHPNIALPPNFVQFTYVAVQHFAGQMWELDQGSKSAETVLRSLVLTWRAYFRQWGREESLRQLRYALNWQAPPSPPPGSGAEPEQVVVISQVSRPRSSGIQWPYILAIAVVAALMLAGLTALLLVYVVKRRRHGRGFLWGNLVPPGENKQTTLIVTDIQGSTELWESLPMNVMDVVIKVHHTCLRSLLPAHRGYESTTEGDSLILAFHDPQSALTYAMEAQQSLIHAPWPVELLDHPLCKEAYIRLVDRDPLDMKMESDGSSMDESSTPGLSACTMLDRFKHTRAPWGGDVEDGDGGCGVLFSGLCQQAWERISKEAVVSEGGTVVVAFRGARVRMGIHTGVGAGERVVNAVDDRRTHYVGACLHLAKLVADCGAGGTVSVSEATYKQLPMEKLWKDVRLWHAGCHVLDNMLEPMHVYQALPPALTCRVSCLPPVRSVQQMSLGALEAPAGCAAVGFMKVAGLEALKSWNPAVTRAAIDLWHQLVLLELPRFSGYPVEVKEDVVVVSFGCVKQSLLWATQCCRALLEADWSEELLSHEMGEQVCVLFESEREGEWRSELMMRGLRVKVGMDWGPVICAVSPMTGKLQYNGRVMNRAARIAARATPGQVLTSSYTWATAGRSPGLLAAPLGPVKLKGIQEDIYLMQVKGARQSDATAAMSCASLVQLDTGAAVDMKPDPLARQGSAPVGGDTVITIPAGELLQPGGNRPLDAAPSALSEPSSSADLLGSDQYTGQF